MAPWHFSLQLKSRFKRFAHNEAGGIPAIEFVMVSIPAIILSMCVVQYMLFANASIVMQSAAHAAARSAMVHSCPPENILRVLDNVASVFVDTCTPNDAEILNAARIALIPISPSSLKSKQRQDGECGFPEALSKIMLGSMRDSDNMKKALENKACYAFEPNNVRVTTEWDDLIGGYTLGKKMPPVTAKVTYRLPVLSPVRMIFSNGSRDDGTRYREHTVKVVFL